MQRRRDRTKKKGKKKNEERKKEDLRRESMQIHQLLHCQIYYKNVVDIVCYLNAGTI